MEAERRSTMSSLKGQLSNVEGSVKSMKAAVVVGSVLTVACLAAVFGVTILANEVSKEVKVSNNTLTTKSGANVMTQNVFVTEKAVASTSQVFATLNGNDVIMAINAIVVDGPTTTIVCDDAVLTAEAGEVDVEIAAESVLASTIGEEVEARNLNRRKLIKKAGKWVWWAGKQVAEGIGGAAVWGEAWGEVKDWFGSDPAPSGCKRRSLLMMC